MLILKNQQNARVYGMDPDHSVEMIEKGLKSGDCLDTDMYPRVWKKV